MREDLGCGYNWVDRRREDERAAIQRGRQVQLHDFDGACNQFRGVFLDSIDFITQSGTPRWWSAAQLIAAAVDALGGAHLQPNGETSGATFRAFIENRFPPDYKPYAAHLYKVLRCGLLHAGRVDKFGRSANDATIGSIYLTHRDIKPVIGPKKTLTISVPHLRKALVAAFHDFRASPTAEERTNFPLRFEIVLVSPWEDQVAVDCSGVATLASASPSGSGTIFPPNGMKGSRR
jgi:hypothetical protein